jgi:hypothetical protein
VLLLLMGLIYDIHRWDELRLHYMHTKIHEDWFGHSGNIKYKISEVGVCVCVYIYIYI